MKRIFIVDGWIPFPSSEYGCLYVVVAEDEEDAVKILTDSESLYSHDYIDMIPKAVSDATSFELKDSNTACGVYGEMVT